MTTKQQLVQLGARTNEILAELTTQPHPAAWGLHAALTSLIDGSDAIGTLNAITDVYDEGHRRDAQAQQQEHQAAIYAIPCPACPAEAGTPCTTPQGVARPHPHAYRTKAYRASTTEGKG